MNRLTKILLLAVMAFVITGLFYGCGKRPEVIESDFAGMVAEGQKVTPETMAEVSEYMDKYLHKLDNEKSSAMLFAYEGYAARYINTDGDQAQIQSLLTYYDETKGRINREKLKKDKITEVYYEKLSDSYISVYVRDGKIVLYPDYGRMAEKFGRNVLPAVAELYEMKDVDGRTPATKNATLQISYEELLSRAARVEELIRIYGGETLILEDAKWMYSTYLNVIFMGTTNSPLFDYQTAEFSGDAKSAYQAFAENNPDLSLAAGINEYFKYLDQVGYKIDYKDMEASKAFFNNCARIVSETEKRVYQ